MKVKQVYLGSLDRLSDGHWLSTAICCALYLNKEMQEHGEIGVTVSNQVATSFLKNKNIKQIVKETGFDEREVVSALSDIRQAVLRSE